MQSSEVSLSYFFLHALRASAVPYPPLIHKEAEEPFTLSLSNSVEPIVWLLVSGCQEQVDTI